MTTAPAVFNLHLSHRHRYPPSYTQRWLLQAALRQGQPALEAWEQWQSQVDIEALDPESHHLLTLLYSNLVRHQIDNPHMGRLKGVYRRTWYANQLLVQSFKSVLQALQMVQVKPLVLREMALVSTCYSDWGHRPVYQFDIFVRRSQTLFAIDALQQLGWVTHDCKPQSGDRLWQPMLFHNASYFQLTLHNHLFQAIPQTYTDEQPWTHAAVTQIGGLPAQVLSPVDQLLHLCLTINQKQDQRPIYWLADAAMLINAITQEAEWVRLITQAQRYEIILPLRYLLIELQALLNLPIPDWVLPSLRKMAISYYELLEYNLLPDNKLLLFKSLLVRFRQHWIRLFSSWEAPDL